MSGANGGDLRDAASDPKVRAVLQTFLRLCRGAARGRFIVDMDGKGGFSICFEPARVVVTGADVPSIVILTDN